MACVHLQQLYHLCQENNLRFSSSDLVRIVCRECQSEEVCPSALTELEEEPAEEAPSEAVEEA